MVTTDVLIIGGGVIGCSIAYHLARAGVNTLVVEKGQPGMEASSAAAGVLALASGGSKRGPTFELKRTSMEMFPPLIEELRDFTGIDAEYLSWGVLSLIRDDEDEKRLGSLYALRKKQGLPADWLSAKQVWKQEPGVTRELRAAVLFSGDHHLDSAKFTQGLAVGAQRRGAGFVVGNTVSQVRREGGRVIEVLLDGERVSSAEIVLAAGAWSGQLGELFGLELPVRPAKGQMLACRAGPFRHVIWWKDRSLVPRSNGEVIIGSTVEFVGFDKEVTLEGVRSLISRAQAMAPSIGKAPWVRAWAGLRPYSPTRRPILCRAPGLDNVILATGHHRSGILLAPITGKLITELITTGAATISLEPFGLPSPRRLP